MNRKHPAYNHWLSSRPRQTYNNESRLPAASPGAEMTIDEKLMRLTERHEALTGHVEILTQDVTQLTNDVRTMRGAMNDLMAGFTTLVELVRSHDTASNGWRAASFSRLSYPQFQLKSDSKSEV
jgi:hypothetical protein